MAFTIITMPKENSCGCVDRSNGSEHQCLCPTTGLVQIIGRKYALPLLSLIAEHRSIRFGEIRSGMNDMSPSTLTNRLAELEQAGLIHRKVFAEIPPRVEYSLTKEGEQLRKSLLSLSKLASRNGRS